MPLVIATVTYHTDAFNVFAQLHDVTCLNHFKSNLYIYIDSFGMILKLVAWELGRIPQALDGFGTLSMSRIPSQLDTLVTLKLLHA